MRHVAGGKALIALWCAGILSALVLLTGTALATDAGGSRIYVAGDMDLLREVAQATTDGSLCALGGLTPYPVLSAVQHFPEDFDKPAAVLPPQQLAPKGQETESVNVLPLQVPTVLSIA